MSDLDMAHNLYIGLADKYVLLEKHRHEYKTKFEESESKIFDLEKEICEIKSSIKNDSSSFDSSTLNAIESSCPLSPELHLASVNERTMYIKDPKKSIKDHILERDSLKDQVDNLINGRDTLNNDF